MAGRRRGITVRQALWLAAGAAGIGLYARLRAPGVGLRPSTSRRPTRFGPRVVILGAGFAGLKVARDLMRRAGDRCRITLVDRHNYHLFTPLLFQVATCEISPYDVSYPIRQFTGSEGVDFLRGTVTGIDLDRRTVETSEGEVPYDYLVVALGSTTNFFGNRSAMEYALPMKWLEDGVAIRHHMIDRLEEASRTSDPEERRALLTFVVVGGGATGVETAGALVDFLNRTARSQYPSLDFGDARVMVLEGKSKLLGHMSDRMSTVTLDRLRKMGVDVWLNTQAREMGPRHLVTEHGRTVRAGTIVWAAGVRAQELVAGLKVPHGKGGSISVNEYLQVEHHPQVYAVGDNAEVEDRRGGSVPLLAQAAEQEGAAVAENLVRAMEGSPQLSFLYRSRGNSISLGSGLGVAEIGPVGFDGLPGNLAWRLIHLAKIPGSRNQIATALHWAFGYVYHQHTERLDLEPAVAVAEATEAPVTAETPRRVRGGRAA